MNTQRVFVDILFDDTKSLSRVGELVLNQKQVYFKYDESFLKTSLEPSPFHLSKTKEVLKGDPRIFDGLPGLFFDSLPDSWGRLLLERALSKKGIAVAQLNALDRLCYVGNQGYGALVYKPEKATEQFGTAKPSLDELANSSEAILQGKAEDLIEELFKLGGSSGGARPKISVAYNPDSGEVNFNQSCNTDFEQWIIKIPSSFDEPDIAHIEYAYYLMAKKAGVEMMPSKLIEGDSGRSYFATKRFDRDGSKRLHVHSAAGLLNDDYRYSQLDYGHLLDASFQLTRHVKTYEKIFRIAAFNLFSHNRDDHSKNFSFLMNEKGEWDFAPAYDLTFSSSSQGHHSTQYAGESYSPNTEHLTELARLFGIESHAEIIERVKSVTSNWKHFAEEAGVSASSSRKIENALNRLALV